jgi:hypothetical protein
MPFAQAGGGGGVTAHTQTDHDRAETADLVAVAATADAGTSIETPNADHRHAHGSGYAGGHSDAAGVPHDAGAHDNAPTGVIAAVAATADGGVSTQVPRGDHRHAHGAGYAGGHTDYPVVPGFGAAGYPVDVAATEDDGVAATVPRSDHRHAHGAGYAGGHTDYPVVPGFGAAGYPVDVAATEDDGVATTVPRSDHRHAHGSGYLPDAHHLEVHTGQHEENGAQELFAENLGTGVAVAGRYLATNGTGGVTMQLIAEGDLPVHDQDQHDRAEVGDLIAVAATADAGTSIEVPNADHRHAHGTGYAGGHTDVAGHAIDGAAHTGTWEFTVNATILDPTAARFVMCWRAPFAATVTNVRGHRKGGTGATVNARRNQTSDFLASDLSLASADVWTDGGAVQNTAIAAGDDIEVEIASITGAVTEIAIQVDLTRTMA